MGEPTTINVKRGEASLQTERWRAVPWSDHPSGEWTWQVEDWQLPGRWYDRHRVDRQHRTLIDRIAALEADLAAAREAQRAWSLALQSLTPGGSEYVDDPARCVTFVREVRDANHTTIMRFKRERDAAREAQRVAERERDALRVVLQETGNWCDGCNNPIDRETCGCGEYIKGHGNPMETGHSPVPMGCDCYRAKEPAP